MSCCGKKRQSVNNNNDHIPFRNMENGDVAGNPQNRGLPLSNITFRYSGNKHLRIRSIYSDRMYKFSPENREIVIVAEDVKMMRGYHELTELNKK